MFIKCAAGDWKTYINTDSVSRLRTETVKDKKGKTVFQLVAYTNNGAPENRFVICESDNLQLFEDTVEKVLSQIDHYELGSLYELQLQLDSNTGKIVSTSDLSEITLAEGDKVIATLSPEMIEIIESLNLTASGSVFEGTAIELEEDIESFEGNQKIESGTVAVDFGAIAFRGQLKMNMVMYNTDNGSEIIAFSVQEHTITIDGQIGSKFTTLQSGKIILSTLDTAKIDFSERLKAILIETGNTLCFDSNTVKAKVASSKISIDTDLPSDGNDFDINTGDKYFDFGKFAYAEGYSINGYIGMQGSTYKPGIVINFG